MEAKSVAGVVVRGARGGVLPIQSVPAKVDRPARVDAPLGVYLPSFVADASKKSCLLENVLRHLRDAIRITGASEAVGARLLRPERTLEFRFAVTMDDGSVRELNGYRILHSSARGPGKGGIRFAADVDGPMIRGLATEMSMKTAIYNLALGGAKGGVAIETKGLSKAELARVMRAYVRGAMDAEWARSGKFAFGPDTDVPAPDVGTSPEGINLMDVATDEYLRWLASHRIERVGDHSLPKSLLEMPPPDDGTTTALLDRYLSLRTSRAIDDLALAATFTGKSIEKGGSQGRSAATGLGVATAALEMLKHNGTLPKDAERFSGQMIAVQGFGNVGKGAVRAFLDLGAKVVAIAEHDGSPYAIFRREGFDRESLDALEAYKKAHHGSLRDFPGTEIVSRDAFFSLPVNVLAPCARENEITPKEAAIIRAPVIVEGANGPTTPEADQVLERLGITVVPDVFANAAGVTVSSFERDQNIAGESWTEAHVNRLTKEYVARTFAGLVKVSKKFDTSLREAAMIDGVMNLSVA
jgi:glutamate dehydrogenase